MLCCFSLSAQRPFENSHRAQDSVLNLPGLKYDQLKTLFEFTRSNTRYEPIDFREYEKFVDVLGYKEIFGYLSKHVHFLVEENVLVLIVSATSDERVVFIKDSIAYGRFAKTYQARFGIAFDPMDQHIFPREYGGFRYGDFWNDASLFKEHFEKNRDKKSRIYDTDTIYSIYSHLLRSLSREVQVQGIRGLYSIDKFHPVSSDDQKLTDEVERSNPLIKVRYARGCLGHAEEVRAGTLISKMKNHEPLPKKWEDFPGF